MTERKKREKSKVKRFDSMSKAVESALKLFPQIEKWAFGEGVIITPSLQKKFDVVKKQLEDSKSEKITYKGNFTPEERKRRSDRIIAWHMKNNKTDQKDE